MFLTRSARYEYRLYQRNRRRRSLTFFLIVVLVLAIAGLSRHSGTHPADKKHRTSTRPAHAPATRAHARTRSTTASTVATAGTGLRWVAFHGIDLPASAQDGPHHTRRGLAWGYSDTPRGALLAAINIAVRTAAQWGPLIYHPTIARQVTGPDTTALLTADASDYSALRAAAHVRPGQPAGRGYAVEAAYRFAAYTPASAAVDVVTEAPGSTGTTVLAVTRVQVTWQHGDWRVIAPPGGDWANSAAAVSSLTGYTTFPSER
jgi:hypothetical protein